MTLHLILLLALLSSACTKKEDLQQYPIFGVDPITNVSLLEEPEEALALWAENRITDATLIHVAVHDSLELNKPDNIHALKYSIKNNNWMTVKESQDKFFTNSNYLYTAVQLGIVKEIYWILPFTFFDVPLAGEEIKKFLKASGTGFKDNEIDSMKMETGCLIGRLSGTDIRICSPRTLPKINTPVIMRIDAGFLPRFAEEYKISKLRSLKRFFDNMTFRQLRVILITISYGTESGYTEPIHRYIGDQLHEVTANPEIIKAQSPPELWRFRDTAENMLSGGEDKLVLEFLEERLKKYPEDLALRLLNVSAKVRIKEFDDAFSETDKLCKQDKNYCYGFVYLGNTIENRNWQKKFFDKAQEALPDSTYVKDIVQQFYNSE